MNTICWAIDQMKGGVWVRRAGWNGKGMYLWYVQPDDLSDMSLPYIAMHTAQGDAVPWLASQTDLLATDWEVAAHGA